MAHPGIAVHLTKDSPVTATTPVLPYRDQNYWDLKRRCLQERRHFIDLEFKPCAESLGYHELGPRSTDIQGVVWKRPKEISRFPKFVRGEMNRMDVCQGQIGDCWFLAAAASLTLYPHLLSKVVPGGQSFQAADYAGIFHFQFWQYGQWVDVVVDDLLPTKDNRLLFVRTPTDDEFWMPLLEKAYAKLNGSYEAMNGGYMNEAFVDFTGGIGETIPLKTPNLKLFKTIEAVLNKSSLMGAYISVTTSNDREAQTSQGLVKGHAYSITGIHKLYFDDRQVRLLRLRNPWGHREWNGRWIDNSPLWGAVAPELREKLHVQRRDGEFWMQLIDFIQYFDVLEICHFNADAPGEGVSSRWNTDCFQGRWVKGYSAGGRQISQPWDLFWINPQFHVALFEPDEAQLRKQLRKGQEHKAPTCTLLVSLMQKDRRRSKNRGKDFLHISFQIFQIPRQYLQLSSAAHRKEMLPALRPVCPPYNGSSRDVTGYFQLPPGDYLIIPSTLSPFEEADFTLRIFTEKKHQFLEIDEEISVEGKVLQVMKAPQIGSDQDLEEIFLKYAGQDQQVGPAELQAILNQNATKIPYLKMEGFTVEECQRLIQHFNLGSRSDKLTLQMFQHLCASLQEWERIFRIYDVDRSGTMNTHEMRLALEAAGFHLNKPTMEAFMKKYSNPWLQIDFKRFVFFMEHLKSVFCMCKSRDTSGSGVLNMTEKEWMELATDY
ncbi:calpain-12 [Pogona vitticeps]